MGVLPALAADANLGWLPALPSSHLSKSDAVSDASARSGQALAARGLPGAWGAPGSLFGVPDTDRCDTGAWELVCEAASAGQAFWAWRRPLRAGLYLYRTHAVIEGATAAQLRRFRHDDAARCAAPRAGPGGLQEGHLGIPSIALHLMSKELQHC